MDKPKIGKIFLATLTGAVIGAAVSVLYAPRSGRATRAKIRMSAESTSRTLGDAAQEIKGSMLSGMEEGGDELGYLIGSAIAHASLTTKEIIKALEIEIVKLQSKSNG